jgi:hypothetical protein
MEDDSPILFYPGVKLPGNLKLSLFNTISISGYGLPIGEVLLNSDF